MAFATYTEEEDHLIWNAVEHRTGSQLQAVANLIKGRKPGAIISRYYYLKSQKELAETPIEDVLSLAPTSLDNILDLLADIRDEVKRLLHDKAYLTSELATAKNKISYQKGRITELEDDQQQFLRLMDKARAITLKEESADVQTKT